MSNPIPDISNLPAVDIGLLLASDQSLDLVPGLNGEPGHLTRNDKPHKPRKRTEPQGQVSRGTQPFPYEHPEPSRRRTGAARLHDGHNGVTKP